MPRQAKLLSQLVKKLTPCALRKLSESGLEEILVSDEQIIGDYIASDIVNMETGEIIAESGDTFTEEM